MFVWRKRAGAGWLAANEATLREVAGQRLAIISKPAHRNAIAEIASPNCSELERIRRRFGGVIEKLPRNWLRKFLRGQKPKPLKIVPASRAFGTGEHVTTAMSLRLLEKTTRFWGAQAASLHSSAACRRRLSKQVSASSRNRQAGSLRSPEAEWALLDLGTGSGILALAAAHFGVKRIIAIDNDPIAIATAMENARRNKIDRVDFKIADVRRWNFPKRVDIITANLFSELLIKILPKLKRARWLILSGVLREQESKVTRALKQNGIVVTEIRRRGKWIAILAQSLPESSRAQARDLANTR
ncbi:MAG: hypothetical protein DME32_06545 [Verrucomicrobia bacterium]|nr:MAG: hypothetical protein DME32_06545 [Verrucomicrobiota bacterium]